MTQICVLGIELHAEAAAVIGGLRLAQSRDSLRGGVAVGVRLADRLLQLLDDVQGRRQIRVAHAEVDDVLAAIARGGLDAVDALEDVGRQAPDAVKIGGHLICLGAITETESVLALHDDTESL